VNLEPCSACLVYPAVALVSIMLKQTPVCCAFLAALVLTAAQSLIGGQTDVKNTLRMRLSRAVQQAPCVRLLRTGGDVGCSTSLDGVVGFLWPVSTMNAISEWNSLPADIPRIAVLPPDLMTVTVLDTLAATPQFVGAVQLISPFPSRGYSPGAPSSWNPSGRGLMQRRFTFPIIEPSSTAESLHIQALAEANAAGGAHGFPAYAMRLFFYMGPEGLDSLACLPAGSCLPLGGQSVWGLIGAANDASTERPLIVATAGMDSAALFHDLAFGADAAVSATAALLVAADALARSHGTAGLPRRVLIAHFQAEQWGRLGSRRWVSEVQQFTCAAPVLATSTHSAFCANPLRASVAFTGLHALTAVTHVIAVDQVGAPGLSSLYLHEGDATSGGAGGAVDEISKLIASLSPSLPIPVFWAPASAAPPSPLTSFQEAASPALRFDGAVLSGYNASYATDVWHSEFDNHTRIDVAAVSRSATVLARVLYALATGIADPDIAAAAVPVDLVANASLAAEIVDCFTISIACNLLARLTGQTLAELQSSIPSAPLPLYTSVYVQPRLSSGVGVVVTPKLGEALVRGLLGLASTDSGISGGEGANSTTCSRNQECVGLSRVNSSWAAVKLECISGRCVAPLAFYHDAFSPAIKAAPGSFHVNASALTREDPAWTEPFWSNRIGATVFLKESSATDYGVLATGLVVLSSSIPLLWMLVQWLDVHYKVP
jgi:nicastrin